MLKIKKLQILGFKSFCDRTELLFPGAGVVGIVGPNGCGKSNLSDAVSWVLGEQSAKSLRGQRMEDVIFAGTRDRKPTGMAEVSLTLINPQEYEGEEEDEDEAPLVDVRDDWDGETSIASDAEAAADAEEEDVETVGEEGDGEAAASPEAQAAVADGTVVLKIRKRRKFVKNNRRGEIVVTRRLYRSGDSEYLMNGRPCRLRDIQDLFMGTGLGPESYAIIEQGRIGQILSSKPYDRRAIIEEAAGVTKYKARKKLAEARLEAARQNLNRINDIFEEVTRQMGSLKRQAAKAQRYTTLKGEFDQHQRRLVLTRALLMEADRQRLGDEHQRLEAELHAAQEKLAGEEAARSEWGAKTAALEQELRQLTERVGGLAMELDRTERQIAFNAQQSGDFQKRVETNRADVERLTEQRAGLETELEKARAEAAGVEAELQRARQTRQQEREASEAASRQVQQLEQKIENARRRVLQALNQISVLSNQITQGETMLAGLDSQMKRLAQEQETAGGEMESFGARRGQLDLEFQGQQQEKQVVETDINALDQRLRGLREQEQRTRQEREQARTHLANVSARKRSLEEIVAQHGYSTDAVKKLFSKGIPASEGERVRPVGLLAEFLEVDARFEQVVEEFLREELNYVVVRTWDQAGAGLGLLRSEQGRATFLIHPDDGQIEMFASHPPAPEVRAPEGGAAPIPLRNCVKVLNGFGHSLEHILPKLGLGYILPDATYARELAAANPNAYFLTAQGECFHNLTVSGGARANTGPLTIKRELRDLAQKEAEQNQNIQQLDARLRQVADDLIASQQQWENQRSRRHELEKQILTSNQGMKQLESEIQRVQNRIRLYQAESERYRQERKQAEEKLGRVREQVRQFEQQRDSAELEERESGASVAVAREQRELAAQRAAEAQSALARLEERARGAQEASNRLERTHRDVVGRLAQLESDIQRFLKQHEDLDNASRTLGEQLVQVREQREQAEARRQELTDALTEARARGAELEERLKTERAALDLVRQRHGELQVALARLDSETGHLLETCRNELHCELDTLRADETLTPAEGEEIAALEQSVRELRTRIDNLGPVNMMALEEFKETEERHQFLETQRKDLLDSIADTQKAIQEIDVVSRQKFNEAFEKINLYFQESFKVLFGGGQGFLKLTDAENDPESGVDIVAQPPGKKLQNALLLSGGEKAMTAMALLLSVFQYQPSPFCVLDEVDAPLDEANVGRFAAMVNKMSEHTQFIIITHNKRTMEIAPTLYGVTMQQPGVSRLVSVQVEERARTMAVV